MVSLPAQRITYREMHGLIEPRIGGGTVEGDVLVLSNIERGAAVSPAGAGLCIRYVATGQEDYRMGERSYRLDPGQVMIGRRDVATEVEIRKSWTGGTFGLCALLASANDDLPWVFGPLVASADCTILGGLMKNCAAALRRPYGRAELAQQLVESLRAALPAVAESVIKQTAAVDAAKPSTRFEMVRRATLAQAYLHSVQGRAVDLDELGRAVGMSPFHLLRAFQHCFGETPSSYHRKLRLELALEEARRRGVAIAHVADDYGFAGVSSFSHAYRRAFGRSPREALAALPSRRPDRMAGC